MPIATDGSVDFIRPIPSVVALLHMDGANGSTTFTDSSPLGLTYSRYGSPQISTGASKIGGASARFNGTGSIYIPNPNTAIGQITDDFTIECWINWVSTPPGNTPGLERQIMGQQNWPENFSGNWWWLVGIDTGIAFNIVHGGTQEGIGHLFTWQPNRWYHIAVSRLNGNLYLCLDGNLLTTVPSTKPMFVDNVREFSIGGDSGGNSNLCDAYIDEVRITKGFGRYTANFTPRTTAFPNNDDSVGAGIQYSLDSGTTWNPYIGPFNTNYVGVSTNILVRVAIVDDDFSDNNETFTLTAILDSGATLTGTATIKDDGSGVIFNTDGTINTTAEKDIDSGLISLLLHMDGANGSTNIIDSGRFNRTVVRIGSGTISTAVRPKVGNASYFSNTLNDLLDVSGPENIGTQDFTVEFWWRPTIFSNGYKAFFQIHNTTTNTVWSFLSNDDLIDRKLFLLCETSSTPTYITSGNSPLTITTNTWHHVAMTRSGTTLRIFFDGILHQSATFSDDMSGNLKVCYHRTNGYTYGPGYFPNTPTSIGYIDEFKIIHGIAKYTSNFTLYEDPSVLLHMDGTNGSSTFIDSGPNSYSITLTGTPRISSTQSKFGGVSGYFDGGSKLTIQDTSAGNLGGGDFTVECWLYWTGVNTGTYSWSGIVCTSTANAPTGWYLAADLTGGLNIWWLDPESGVFTAYDAGLQNSWNHIAVTRGSGILRIYINGVVRNIRRSTTNLNYNLPLAIGSDNGGEYLVGYIDELRICKGVAKYGNFTLPAMELIAVPNTALLLNMNGTNNSTIFTDSSPNNFSVVANGNAKLNTTIKKFGTSSAYFDGNGDYLRVASNSAFNFSGDFTIEFWVHPTLNSTFSGIITKRVLDASGTGTWGIYIDNGDATFANLQNSSNVRIGVVALNVWTHIAVCRSSGKIYTFLNGNLTGMLMDSTNFTNNNDLIIGAWDRIGFANGYYWYEGYIDDLRIVNGVAMYTGDFIPQTIPFEPS